ncbi:MAG: DNA topoisomerase [Clostridiales bacterium]|nr:MAG: DNA topoisomerase [Clostridiales bacterium]PWL99997.1 MAG: DNA topoisomerase [Clostridiales bacterium]
MAKKTNVYDDKSITMLKGAERVRSRPAVIFGSDGLEGCEHSVFEILSNAVDEAREGYGDKINITAYHDGSIRIEDFGRGVPLDYNENEGKYNWELVYCELYAGSKYNNNAGDDALYQYSLGLNGLGAAATQYSSEFMKVQSYRGTEMLEMNFKKGEPDGELIRTPLVSKKEQRTGTVVYWKPDLEVFTSTDIPREYYESMLDRQAVVNAGLRFCFRWQNEDGTFDEKDFYYEHGIEDQISRVVGDTALTAPVLWKTEARGRDRADKPEYSFKAEIAFCFSNTVNLIEYYHNSSFLEHGGSPDKATRTAFVYAIDKYLKSSGKYNKNESKITFGDIEDCLVLIINSFSTQTSYENQTKKAISNEFITETLTDFLKRQLEIYFIENPADAEKIAGQVLVNKRSRENAESTRLNLKKKLSSQNDVANRVEKFVSCRSRDPERRELYIVEGDSAMTSCKLGRDAEFQAIIPVRGKTLNCLKSDYDRIFKNEIIVDLLKVIGCGVEVGGKGKTQDAFDMSQLKWSKIIICTDADEDGYQIRTLILTIFYRLLPTLIKEGRVYIAESPLFEITCKDKIYFAYDENEKQKIVSGFGGAKYTLQRSKGLGENEPDMMWQTTMNPETRRLIKIMEADRAKTEYIFETLLGDDLPERKKFIAEYGREYLAEADI